MNDQRSKASKRFGPDRFGLHRAWERGELAKHPAVMASVGLLFAGLLAFMLIRGAGRWSSYEVTDFSQPDSRRFSALDESNRIRQVFRFSVRVVGNVDGEFDLYLNQEKLDRLGGRVDSRFSVPTDSDSMTIKLVPVNDGTGHLILHHRFHYR